jgi:RNA polymerase sigma-32 factor
VQWYLAEIERFHLLSREKEKELAIRLREHGDKDAARILITSNLTLVAKIAVRYSNAWRILHLSDLIQEGNVGLILAVNKFDARRNVRLSYYASFWIKAYITRFIIKNWSLVKIGTTQGQRKLFFNLKNEKHQLSEQGFYPNPALLSERLGVSEREIVEMDERLDGRDVSLDAAIKDDSNTRTIESIKDTSESVEDQVSKNEINDLFRKKVAEFRRKLTKRELEIFDRRIFTDCPATLCELGTRCGISRQRVGQVEGIIIRKMRKFLLSEYSELMSLN